MTDSTAWQAPGGTTPPPPPIYGGQPPLPAPGAQPGWTPPPKPGLIPLRPIPFGTLLGASFQVMRRNPRPTLGVAMLFNGAVVVLFAAIFATIGFLAFSRIESATSANIDDVAAGTVGASILAGIIPIFLSLIATAILQGIISLEVARGTVGEKLRFAGLWRLARGRIAPLIGWSLLLGAVLLVAGILFALIIGLGVAAGGAAGVAIAVIFTLLLGLAFVAASVWVGTKLSLVPSVLMLERTTLWRAIARSWSLTNGFFWRTFGTQLLVNAIVQTAAQIITFPVTLVVTLGGTLLNPNNEEEAAIALSVALLLATGALSVLFGAISLVILSSVSALIYIDIRMRKEGLDLELSRYVEARQAGDSSVTNPYERVDAAAPPPPPASPTDSPWA